MAENKPGTGPIHILDEIEALEGREEELRDAYFERYAPGARSRGMTFEHCWRTPATLPGRTTTLYFVWSVADAQAWWFQMRIPGQPEKAEFWASIKPLIARRSRRFLVDYANGNEA